LVQFDRQFCDWRDNLPPHLSFNQSRENLVNEPLWITRARSAIICHFHHIYIVMHRPLLTAPYFSTPFLSSEASNEMGINAAKENISLIHSLLQYDPPLRKWVYYCYYNFMAELIILTMLVQQPFAEDARDWAAFCNMATESFDWMLPLNAAAKCRAMSKNFLDEWKGKVQTNGVTSSHASDTRKRRQTYNPEGSSNTPRIRSQSHPNVSSPQLSYIMQPQAQNTFPQSFGTPSEFRTSLGISPQNSDTGYSPLNPTRYDMQPAIPYYTMQNLDAAVAETLQSFSGLNQGIFMNDGAMGWTYNFEDLFGDMTRNDIDGQGTM
jgi:hypothetical protein